VTGQRRAVAATIASSIAVLLAALLPWLRTGEAHRSAFGLVRSAAVLGLFDGPARRACLVIWLLLPLLVAATWTAGALRKPMAVATLGGVVGSASVIAGVLVMRLVPAQPGSVAAIVTGAATMASAGLAVRTTVRGRRSSRMTTEGAAQ
jgi:hypothetical protein